MNHRAGVREAFRDDTREGRRDLRVGHERLRFGLARLGGVELILGGRQRGLCGGDIRSGRSVATSGLVDVLLCDEIGTGLQYARESRRAGVRDVVLRFGALEIALRPFDLGLGASRRGFILVRRILDSGLSRTASN